MRRIIELTTGLVGLIVDEVRKLNLVAFSHLPLLGRQFGEDAQDASLLRGLVLHSQLLIETILDLLVPD